VLYKFKSKDSGDVIMLEANGRRILEVIGKSAGPTGIIQAAEIPAALTALHGAIDHEEGEAKKKKDEDAVPGDGLSLRQRAKPFIDMLERSQKARVDIVWGV
jgi:hypothetical protein